MDATRKISEAERQRRAPQRAMSIDQFCQRYEIGRTTAYAEIKEVDGYRLRDLVDGLDRVLDTLELYDFNDDDTAAIKQRDLFRIERALEAAAAFLHEFRLGEPS
jgi:hypothetical protein